MEPSLETTNDNLSGMSGIYSEIIDLLPQLDQHLELQTVDNTMNTPYIEILEQPKAKVRFRYLCEGRSAGAIVGANSNNDNKSYPTIQIQNYKGDAHVVVSCVTVDEPYRPHPHKLVDKENTCRDGIFFKHFNQENNEEMKFTLANVGIQCMKKKDIDNSLKKRQEQGVDPFGTGYDHRKNASSINLNAVRLCFQVFLPTADPKEVKRLKPVVSETIYDAKSNADLIIHQLSHSSDTVAGGMKMILLCDKVNKDDIKIRFYEEQDGLLVWEDWGIFTDKDVHKQYAITFKTPRYRSFEISDPIDVKIQLMNSKDSFSDPCNFKFTPLDSEDGHPKRKRPPGNEPDYYRELKNNIDPDSIRKKPKRSPRGGASTMEVPQVKVEPSESTQYYLNPSVSPYHHSRTPSPSYTAQYQPNYTQPFSPDGTSQATYVNSPPSMFPPSSVHSPDPTSLFPISPHNNPVFVRTTPNPAEPGACGGEEGSSSFSNILINMDTRETSSYSGRRPGDSLNEVDSADLLDPTALSQNLNESLNISETQNMSDSLTNIANQAYNSHLNM